MPGQLSHEQNIGFVKSCSFGVSPTLIESFGMAILEACFCGVPMVAFEVGGTGEVIRDGENGLLAPLLDLEALQEMTVRMLDSDYCNEIRIKTRPSVEERFASNRVAGELLSLCKRYVNR